MAGVTQQPKSPETTQSIYQQIQQAGLLEILFNAKAQARTMRFASVSGISEPVGEETFGRVGECIEAEISLFLARLESSFTD